VLSTIEQRSTPILLSVAIHRYFELALYLLVFTGFATLASTGGLDIPTVVAVSAALLVRGYSLAKRRTLLIPERWTTVLTVVYVAFYLVDYLLISGSFLNATVHLVLFVMVVRLFSAHRARDHYFLSVISFLMVLAAALLTVDSSFLLAFGGFLLMAAATFVLMEMKRSSAKATIQCKESSDLRAYRHMAFSLAIATPMLVVLIVIGAAAIFFVLPRISAGYLSGYSPVGELTTGFNDRVQLGSIGQIQQSSAVVMHIQIEGDHGGGFDLDWRGVTLNLFDGRTWTNSQEKRVLAAGPEGLFALSNPAGGKPWAEESLKTIHYRVLMEPIGVNVFFLAAVPQILRGNYSLIAIDSSLSLFDLDLEHPVSGYQATSRITKPDARLLRASSDSFPAPVLLNYLQLPALDPRIPLLAQQIAVSADNNYDKAKAVENYLRTNFQYTLQLPRTIPRDPLANFLFERKQGHCEYFASSMAVMLRSLRIPSRVVNGFRTGEFNDLTSQYLVRASDAHSWVEAYFPGYGWVSFDPTPAGPGATHGRWSRMMMYWDAMQSFWREWIINFDTSHQQILGQGAVRGSRQLFDQARNWARQRYIKLLLVARHIQKRMMDSPVRWSIVGLLVSVPLLFLVNARRLLRGLRIRRIAAHPEKSPRLAASIWYERMMRLVERRGWRKSPAQTPAEFVTCIRDISVRDSVARFTRHYEGARFGDSAQDAGRLPELFDEITATARR
jgi:transglutaminase-like putative cysteine protease